MGEDWAARGLPADGQARIEMAFGIIRGMGGLAEMFPFREAAADLRGQVDASFYVDPTAAQQYLSGRGSVDVQLRLLDAAADFADAMELARREVAGDVAAADRALGLDGPGGVEGAVARSTRAMFDESEGEAGQRREARNSIAPGAWL